jgi:hypothetical protein
MANLSYLPLILASLKWAVLVIGLLYVVAAFGISLIAGRLRDSQSWMSWIPVVNLILVCRLAKVNPAWILPALIPVVNVFVFGFLGARIAQRLDTSGALGALFGVPILGAFVPLLLAAAGRSAPLPEGAQVRPVYLAVLTDLAVIAVLLVGVGIAFKMANSMTRAVQPSTAQVAQALSAPVAGTLRVFPIDTATENAAQPSNVIAMSFVAPRSDTPAPAPQVQQTQLPPWVAPESLGTLAESGVAATFHSDGSASPGVSVVSLALRDSEQGFKPPSREQLAAAGLDGAVTGVELQSASGIAYTGFRVATAVATYYIMQEVDGAAAVMISALSPDDIEVADRLAANVGNGDGLLQYEDYRSVFYALPSTPPGTNMNFSLSLTATDIERFVQEFEQQLSSIDTEDSAEMSQILGGMTPEDLSALARTVMPSTLLAVSFADGDTSDTQELYMAGVAGYESGTKAWTVMQTIWNLRFMVNSAMAMLPDTEGLDLTIDAIEIAGNTAYTVQMNVQDEGAMSAFLVRKGAMLAVFGGIGSIQELTPWVQEFASRQ